MSYREYFRLQHAEPAGALVLRNRELEVTEYDCDICGSNMGPRTDVALDVGAYRRAGSSGHVRVTLDVCERCFGRLPSAIRARLAHYGLDLGDVAEAAGNVSEPVAAEPRR